MRIAQVSPLYESVPPKLYGGTERVVAYLTDELAAMGHEVTLFASGDSSPPPGVDLVAGCASALRLDELCVDPLPHHLAMLEEVARRADDFDVIHFHVDYLHLPLTRRLACPHLTTLHGRLDIPDLVPLYLEFADVPLVSISDSQRKPLPWANWKGTILHGLPPALLRPGDGSGRYLAFVGRISPEKRVDWAIEIAAKAGLPIRIAAKIGKSDEDYFRDRIRPLLSLPHVTFVGEIDERQKDRFLGDAAALLFPIDWPEPFGLVQIEAMACGTPVIAFPFGAVPEVVDDGVTGFVCHNVDHAVDAVTRRLPELSRRRCRERFERRFSARRMAADYVRTYQRVIGEWTCDRSTLSVANTAAATNLRSVSSHGTARHHPTGGIGGNGGIGHGGGSGGGHGRGNDPGRADDGHVELTEHPGVAAADAGLDASTADRDAAGRGGARFAG
jgi:glycosyltransferase involved in cell wall biosynthesis